MKILTIIDNEMILVKNCYYIKKNDFVNLYLEQNLTKKELSERYSLSITQIDNIIRIFNVPKEYSLVKKNINKTVKEKYGVENVSQIKEVKDKKENKSLLTYGVKNISQAELIKNKKKESFLKKYGREYLFQTEEFKEEVKNKNLSKYGVPYISQKRIPPETVEILSSAEKFKQYLKKYSKKVSYDRVAEDLHVSRESIALKARDYNLRHRFLLKSVTSKPEESLVEYLDSLGVIISLHDRKILPDRQEIDIYLPQYKIGIEFNGTYYHSDLFKEKKYHFNKTLQLEKKGIRLIHIFEYEWSDPIKRDVIKSLLCIALGKVDTKIYARNCEIREISNEDARSFNNLNHLQGHRNAQVTYGLYYKNKLVQLMSFSKTKNAHANGAEWEIIRGCPGSNNIVVGGVSKLFKHFIKEYHPESIFSYCDFNKFDGKGYEAIGMKFIGYTGPDMKWVLSDMTVIGRQPMKHKELKKSSFAKIYGAGSKKYIWKAD